MIDFMKLQYGSDICGVALEGVPGEEVVLTEEVAGAIAGSFAYWLGFKVGKNLYDLRICVGQDPRLSGDTLKSGLLKGIAMFGAEGYDAGLSTTPAMFMSTILPQLDFDGAIMITASQQPWNWNGFKFFTKYGDLEKEDIAKILRVASKYNFVGEFYEERDSNVLQMYAAYLRQMISMGLKDVPGGLSGMHIVVDAGNGAGGFFAKEVLEPMGADISGSLFLEPDGSFPNHEPDPWDKDAMASICKAVTDNGADLGILFDDDADRVAIIGPDGKSISRNAYIALAASLAADDYPGGTVVTDSITSCELTDFLEKKLGLKHLRYKRGYCDIIRKAKDLNAEIEENSPGKAFLAIETSGRAAFADNFYFDDGAFLAVQIIINAAKLKKDGKNINSLIDGLEAPAESCEVRLDLTAGDHEELGTKILEDAEKWVRDAAGMTLEVPNFEGVRVNYRVPLAAEEKAEAERAEDQAAGKADKSAGKASEANGWFLLRKSLHGPAMVLNVESDTEGGIDAVLPRIYDFIGKYEGTELPQ